MKHSCRSFAILALIAVLSGCTKDNPVAPDTPLGVPTLKSPLNGGKVTELNPTVTWSSVSGAAYYRIQISKKLDFSTIAYDTTWSVTAKELPYLDPSTTYYWHVRAADSARTGAWSDTWSFTTDSIESHVPGIGSQFIFEESKLDSAYHIVPGSGEAVNLTVRATNATISGKSGVTVLDIASSNDPFYVQHLPDGDVAFGGNIDHLLPLPVKSGNAITFTRDTILAGSRYHESDLITHQGTETFVVGSIPLPTDIFIVTAQGTATDTLTHQSTRSSSRSYYYWAPSIGFFTKIRTESDWGGYLDELKSYDIK